MFLRLYILCSYLYSYVLQFLLSCVHFFSSTLTFNEHRFLFLILDIPPHISAVLCNIMPITLFQATFSPLRALSIHSLGTWIWLLMLSHISICTFSSCSLSAFAIISFTFFYSTFSFLFFKSILQNCPSFRSFPHPYITSVIMNTKINNFIFIFTPILFQYLRGSNKEECSNLFSKTLESKTKSNGQKLIMERTKEKFSNSEDN